MSRFRLACEMDKLYILGNRGDKVKISLDIRVKRVRHTCAG
jgi:hypothetical protein